MIEVVIKDTKNMHKPICCRSCQMVISWMHPLNEAGDSDQEFLEFRCYCVLSETIFRVNVTECCETMLKLLDEKRMPPQRLALGLHLVLLAMQSVANPVAPIVPNNPIETLWQIHEESDYMLRLGGRSNVIFAELYDNEDHILLEGDTLIKNFPILYLADTITIPTRFFLFALKYKLNTREEDYQWLLVDELAKIANSVVKANSNLIMGTNLKKIITPDCYEKRKHNFASIVNIDSLSPDEELAAASSLDEHRVPDPNNVAHIWDEIASPIVQLCSGINVLVANIERTRATAEEYYLDLQKYLDAAMWMKTFHNTPFETFLFAITHPNT